MRERIGITSELVYWTLVGLVLVALLAAGGLAIQRYAYPWWLSIQRKAVEDSKSFTDSNNNMLQTYILEHARLDTKIAEAGDNSELIVTYQAQQKAIVEKMCRQVSTMKKSTVNPDTLSWLNRNGGCR